MTRLHTRLALAYLGLGVVALLLGACGDGPEPVPPTPADEPVAPATANEAATRDDNPCGWPDQHCEPFAVVQLDEIRRLAQEDFDSPENVNRERIDDALFERIKRRLDECLKPTLRGPKSNKHVCEIPEACPRLQGLTNTARGARAESDNAQAHELWLSCSEGLDSFPDDR